MSDKRILDPREIIHRMTVAINDNSGVFLSREEARLLRAYITKLYGVVLDGVGQEGYNALCDEVAKRESTIRAREEG